MNGEIKPKKIVADEGIIITKSKAVVDKFKAEFQKLYSLGRTRAYKYSDGDLMDLKTFLLIVEALGLLSYNSLEEKLHTWMIIERLQDPEESIFRMINKIIQKGKYDERIEVRIRPIMLPKLHSELTFDEFVEQLTIFLCKAKDVNPKLTTFANKLNNTLKTMFESTVEVIQKVYPTKKTQAPRTFPTSQKDRDFQNIELIKAERQRLQKLKASRHVQHEEERAERLLMRENDLDIDDFLVSPKKDIDAFEQEDESDEFDIENDGECFFDVVDKHEITGQMPEQSGKDSKRQFGG